MTKKLTPREAHYRLKNSHGVDVHLRTFERWMRDGGTPAKTFIGRTYFDEGEFDSWVKKQWKPLIKPLKKSLHKGR